ncbi:MAG: T9SS type A sorting domain-containing protein [Chitinophagales bacterium]|nr:T9SS type A sorting domain-containing protein [Chitinophagales bacterium]
MSSSISWESLNNGYGTSQFYTVAIEQGETDSDAIIGGLQDNGTWLTNSINPNADWISTFYGDGAYCAIAENGSSYFVSWQGGKTFKFAIDENGQTTALTRIDPTGGSNYRFINPFILDPNNDNTMYLPAGSFIWKNDSLDDIPLLNDEYNDISTGWTRLNESSTNTLFGTSNYISAIGMSKENSDVLYYGTYNGIVYKLSGLLTGTLVKENLKRSNLPSGAYVSSIIPNPNDANEVLLSYSNYEVESIFYTNDAGSSWENISGSLEENPDGSGAGPSVNWMHWYQDDTDTIFFAGTTSGLFATTDLNAENTVWERQAVDEIGNVPVTMITSRSYDKNIVVATHGRGIFSTKNYNVGIAGPMELEGFDVAYPYPNPSNGKVQINIKMSNNSHLSIRVFDLIGNHIETIANERFTSGSHKLKWSTQNYKEGIYLVLLSDGTQSVRRKFKVAY